MLLQFLNIATFGRLLWRRKPFCNLPSNQLLQNLLLQPVGSIPKNFQRLIFRLP